MGPPFFVWGAGLGTIAKKVRTLRHRSATFASL
jgi:hypothetical protein